MSTSSRQEAMEGEPVRRHVSDAVLKYDKPVYGMFVAVKIDTNTAETFRHGVWYAKGDVKQRLTIIPLTLEQYRRFFISLFENGTVHPDEVRDLLVACSHIRDTIDAPGWKNYINDIVNISTHPRKERMGIVLEMKNEGLSKVAEEMFTYTN